MSQEKKERKKKKKERRKQHKLFVMMNMDAGRGNLVCESFRAVGSTIRVVPRVDPMALGFVNAPSTGRQSFPRLLRVRRPR